MAFSMEVERIADNAAICRVTGSLDAGSAPDFEGDFLMLADDAKIDKIILEMSDLDYIASAGLRVLLKGVKAVDARKAVIYGVGMRGTVRSVLKMTGFFRYINENPSIEDCLS